MSEEPEVRAGLVAPAVAAEHPGLRLAWTDVHAAPGPAPAELRARLRAMADRIRGADAIALRHRDVPHAHRVFFRHVGLDPDVVRTPVEELVLRRMGEGGLRSRGLVADALTVAVLETGVGVWAFDAAAVVGAPRIGEADRPARDRRRGGPAGRPVRRSAAARGGGEGHAPDRARGGRRPRGP